MQKWKYSRVLAAFYIADEQIHSLTTYRDGKRMDEDFMDLYVSELGHQGLELVNAQVIGVAGTTTRRCTTSKALDQSKMKLGRLPERLPSRNFYRRVE